MSKLSSRSDRQKTFSGSYFKTRTGLDIYCHQKRIIFVFTTNALVFVSIFREQSHFLWFILYGPVIKSSWRIFFFICPFSHDQTEFCKTFKFPKPVKTFLLMCTVVSIELFLFSFMPFSYNGVYFGPSKNISLLSAQSGNIVPPQEM